MSDERSMFQYERAAGPPPRWLYVLMTVAGAVELWLYQRGHVRYQQLLARVGYQEGLMERASEVLIPLSLLALGVSGLLKGASVRKFMGAISLAMLAAGAVAFVLSFFTD